MESPPSPLRAILWLLAPVPKGSRIDAVRHQARSTLARKAGSRLTWALWFFTDRPRFWALFREVQCHLTAFFRDPDVVASLSRTVLPLVVRRTPSGGDISIWVPGCSTGAEAYSLAILLAELLGDCGAAHHVRMLGTDRSDEIIHRARTGFYSVAELAGVSPARLERFFTPEHGGHRVNEQIRAMCSFSRHDLQQDPPPENLDLISCRNVLTYFVRPSLHANVFCKFHECLRPRGFLVLGRGERVQPPSRFFLNHDRRLRIFRRAEPSSSTPEARSSAP